MQTNNEPRLLTADLRQTLVEAIHDEADSAGWDAAYTHETLKAVNNWPLDKPVPDYDYEDLDEDELGTPGRWPAEAIIHLTVDFFIGHWPGE